MTQPAAVPYDGNDKTLWVPTIADIDFPALTELGAGTVFDFTCYLIGEGWNPTMTEAPVPDERQCSEQDFQLRGRQGWNMTLNYVINPESPDDDEARDTFVTDAVGHIVERPAVDYDTAIAAWDWVQVWSVKLGTPQLAGRTANGRWIMQQVAFLRPPGVTDGLVQVIAS